MLEDSHFLSWFVETQEISAEINLVLVESRLGVREHTDAAATKVQSGLDLDVLGPHREGLPLLAGLLLLDLELHVLPALIQILVEALI